MTLKAHARSSDPHTSHDAAKAISGQLTTLQRRVDTFARSCGYNGFCDAEMDDRLGVAGSTYRTRRAELAARNILIDSGRRRAFGDSPRLRIVWQHRDYVDAPPPIIDPCAPSDRREEARRLANSMIAIAASFRNQGQAKAADQIERGAKMLREFAA